MPANLLVFLETLESFRDVVDSCFGFLLDPYYKQVLAKFRDKFSVLQKMFNVSMTNKLHIISTHVEDFCDQVGRGLGEYSEQETENAHSALKMIWDRYRVRDLNSKVYHVNYFKAVMNFNSNNV